MRRWVRRRLLREPHFCVLLAIIVIGSWAHWSIGIINLNPEPEAHASLVVDPSVTSAWATLITDDRYLLGAMVTVRSILHTKPMATKVICLVTNNVTSGAQRVLRAAGCTLRLVDPIAAPDVNRSGRYAATYTKLHVWDLTHYKLVVYVDADVLVLRNTDDVLFRQRLPSPRHVAASRDCCDLWNPGVMVLRPDSGVYTDMLHKMQTMPSWDGGDGGFLNQYFGNRVQYLPFRYAADQIALSVPRNRRAWQLEDLVVIHFTGPKPWDHLTSNDTNRAARQSEVGGMPSEAFRELTNVWDEHYRRLCLGNPELMARYAEFTRQRLNLRTHSSAS